MQFLKVILGFLILFAFYHGAEYMMLFKNSPAGFLLLQAAFFIAAYTVARFQGFGGLGAWGIQFNKKWWRNLFAGLIAGGLVYILYFITSLAFDVERISNMPSLNKFLPSFFLFTFGTFFSSLSEDVLTRGYVYRHFNGILAPRILLYGSAILYVLNHIYRLADGLPVWTYLFVIGIFLMMALVKTGNLGLTLGLHWSGNIVYQSTNNIIQTGPGNNAFAGNYLYIFFLLTLIPVTLYLGTRLTNSFGETIGREK
ncbi:CPBP family intramembrane glutamic endopeptidase [Flavihumibacter profundi]|uniref:CPBP family intramembrane glutamic endopeptidase n=1 Tax=Flavihumibacter profundi TaxID=2716883 RepID=UPI001CC3AB4B|nr:CPBP family intramembrane glutamic endopeptidase [Flavihumibacter profundi]MBZ5857430.1 CPBP family intramembrane metalloprotease [Flavihumibacter profundi]